MTFAEFHFLRPWWLLALLPLALLLATLLRRKLRGGNWQAVCDPQLLPHLLLERGARDGSRRWPLVLAASCGVLAILAQAGPAFRKLPQPVFRAQDALVVALDLSLSMDAADLKPSRLERARLKLIDLLRERRDGQTALVAYAARPYVVSPLTDDSTTVAALVPSLRTDLMPGQGSRADLALLKAAELLSNAGASKGRVLLVTDAIDAERLREAHAAAPGVSLSVLGVGTPEGGPVLLARGGFLRSADGEIVVPKLDEGALRRAAAAGGGRYALMSVDDSDLAYLLGTGGAGAAGAAEGTELETDLWREEGPWLLLVLLPLASLAFRRGWVAAVALIACVPYAPPASAAEWVDLWQRPDQRASGALAQGDAATAAELFEDPLWRATAQYRDGRYEESAQTLDGLDGPLALYNRGNALAQTGRIDEAISSYERTLELDPGHEDARHNLELLKDVREQQQEQQQQQQGNQDGERQDGEQQDGEGQQGESGSQQAGAQDSQTDSGSAGERRDGQPQGEGQQAGDRSADEQTGSEGSQAGDEEGSEERDAARAREGDGEAGEQGSEALAAAAESPEEAEARQAAEQWLRRIPDDPGGLLRRKFRNQYQREMRRGEITEEQERW